MSVLFFILVVLVCMVSFFGGLTDRWPSFWRGVGKGLFGNGECSGDTYLFVHDHHTGLGIGTRIADD